MPRVERKMIMLHGITPKKKVILDPPNFDQKNGVLLCQSRHFPRYSANTFLTPFFRAAVTTVRALSLLHQTDNNFHSLTTRKRNCVYSILYSVFSNSNSNGEKHFSFSFFILFFLILFLY